MGTFCRMVGWLSEKKCRTFPNKEEYRSLLCTFACLVNILIERKFPLFCVQHIMLFDENSFMFCFVLKAHYHLLLLVLLGQCYLSSSEDCGYKCGDRGGRVGGGCS